MIKNLKINKVCKQICSFGAKGGIKERKFDWERVELYSSISFPRSFSLIKKSQKHNKIHFKIILEIMKRLKYKHSKSNINLITI